MISLNEGAECRGVARWPRGSVLACTWGQTPRWAMHLWSHADCGLLIAR